MRGLPTGVALVWVLRVYAGFFLAVPALRYLALNSLNARRKSRNDARQARAQAVEREALTSASALATRIALARAAAAQL